MNRKEIKPMHHLFTCVDKKELYGTDRLESIFLFNRKLEEVVQIPDDFIVNNPTFLYGYETHWESPHDASCGLCYYGITIIPFESLSTFTQRIQLDQYFRELSSLVKLCSTARNCHLDILHWGM